MRAGRGRAAGGAKRAIGGVKWRVLSVPVPDVVGAAGASEPQHQKREQKIEAVLLMPPPPMREGDGSDSKKAAAAAPLVVIPHGGPHGVMPTLFVPAYAFLCATQGFAVLHVNFRGSTGMHLHRRGGGVYHPCWLSCFSLEYLLLAFPVKRLLLLLAASPAKHPRGAGLRID